MAVLLFLLIYVSGLYWLADWIARHLPARGGLLVHFNRLMALGCLAYGVYALAYPLHDQDRSYLAFMLIALGLWLLPLPEQASPPGQNGPNGLRPSWRQLLAALPPWRAAVLLLALAGIVYVGWSNGPDTEGGRGAVASDSARPEAEESLVFHPLGPRRPTSRTQTTQAARTFPGATAPVAEEQETWWLLRPAKRSPAPAAGPSAPAAKLTPSARLAGTGSDAAGSRAALRPPAAARAPVPAAPLPAGVNQPVISNMLARAEALLQQGRRQEAAAVAGNVLAFDPGNPAARRIRELAGGAVSSR